MRETWSVLARALAGCCASLAILSLAAQPTSIQLQLTNGTKLLHLPLVPGVEEFRIFSTPNLNLPFAPSATGSIQGYLWRETGLKPNEFYQLQIVPKASNAVLTATALNRVAYGPTPDELERVQSIGPEAFIQEQLTPWTLQEDLAMDRANLGNEWQYITQTGQATGNPVLYIYLSGAGDCYIDDLKLVSGTVPGSGSNLIRNGSFESGLTSWSRGAIMTNSTTTTAHARDGVNSLHVIALDEGESRDTSVYQSSLPLSSGQTYTLSYWYKPGTNRNVSLTIRLSGSLLTSSPDTLGTKLELGTAKLNDLRAWHALRAVEAKRQLLEVLLQFFENHFVTQHRKTREYLDRYYSFSETDVYATRMEYMENKRWREALLRPGCTFHDLLKISAESPAMIIYLDTVGSKGNSGNIANENYARELLELFTFGVDNGYDQNDIIVVSRAWTGWSIRLVDPQNEFNPFARQSTTLRPGGTNVNDIEQLLGVWAFAYKAHYHYPGTMRIFPGHTVPERFGSPYAGRAYELLLSGGTGNTNTIQNGYRVLQHLANQPFTQEFISVKLCRLFVHEDFDIGYDFTDPKLSPEGQLVRQCMRAWEESTPKGQIWKVLEVIFNSELFRTQSASMQKVKTPFEFTVSAIRALRAQVPGATPTFTSTTDGYALSSPLNRMGRMRLFDRDDPDGYPESGAPWISAGTLAERVRYVQSYLLPRNQRTGGNNDAGNTSCDPVRLLKLKLPANQWNNARALAEYFAHILFPAEGKANLNEYMSEAETYLNLPSGISGDTQNIPFANLSHLSSGYDHRVRGMVAMLMSFPRFQEQ